MLYLENYQTDKGVTVPEVLRPFVGTDFLPFKEELLPKRKKKRKERKEKVRKKTKKTKKKVKKKKKRKKKKNKC